MGHHELHEAPEVRCCFVAPSEIPHHPDNARPFVGEPALEADAHDAQGQEGGLVEGTGDASWALGIPTAGESERAGA